MSKSVQRAEKEKRRAFERTQKLLPRPRGVHDINFELLRRLLELPPVPYALHRQIRLLLRLRTRIVQVAAVVLRGGSDGFVLLAFRSTAVG